MRRRDFISSAAAAGFAFSAVPITEAKTAQRYRTALIGTGWWGMNILRTALQVGHSTVVGMCDVDLNQLEPAVDEGDCGSIF